mmetsp:Transcript_77038/g.220680  ORF Transcript_77038/g.220680 Transcript_77038/m.220680 type:complete len:229 (-) Transcript_77038:321-1007(-)
MSCMFPRAGACSRHGKGAVHPLPRRIYRGTQTSLVERHGSFAGGEGRPLQHVDAIVGRMPAHCLHQQASNAAAPQLRAHHQGRHYKAPARPGRVARDEDNHANQATTIISSTHFSHQALHDDAGEGLLASVVIEGQRARHDAVGLPLVGRQLLDQLRDLRPIPRLRPPHHHIPASNRCARETRRAGDSAQRIARERDVDEVVTEGGTELPEQLQRGLIVPENLEVHRQ